MIPEVIIIMCLAGVFAFVAYLVLSARHKERMALLEYDRDISVFKGRQMLRVGGALKLGLVLLFGGVGIIVGHLLHSLFGVPEEVATFSLLFISAGSGLLTYYFLANKINEE